MIPSVRGRRAFADLDRLGRRASAGALRIVHRADATSPPRLALAIDRRVANAVARNRVRRRLRPLFAAVAAERPDLVAGGDYLLRVRSADFTTAEARQWLIQALERLQEPRR